MQLSFKYEHDNTIPLSYSIIDLCTVHTSAVPLEHSTIAQNTTITPKHTQNRPKSKNESYIRKIHRKQSSNNKKRLGNPQGRRGGGGGGMVVSPLMGDGDTDYMDDTMSLGSLGSNDDSIPRKQREGTENIQSVG